MAAKSGHSDLDRVMAGIRAQLDRSSKFTETIDIPAAVETSRRVVRLLDPQLERIRVEAGLPEAPPPFAAWRANVAARRLGRLPVPSDRVFTYWDKPLDTAPPLVQACIAQLRRVHPTLQVLDGASTRELIDVPDRIATLLEHDRPAHFSDYVRTKVLEQHGGIWVDATAWVARNLHEELQTKYLRAGVIFPRWTKRAIANWFIASQPRTWVLSLQRIALDAWWDANDDLPDYFIYHRIFDVIQSLVPEARGQWNAAPTLGAPSAHLLQLAMMQPYDARVVDAMLAAAPLQKLSYKYDEVPPGSVLEHLLAGDLSH